MSSLASDVLARVRAITMDTGGVFWGNYMAQTWLNEGRKLYVTMKPDDGAAVVDMPVSAGSMQTIPANAIAFIKAIRNVGGPAVTVADMADIEAVAPMWMDATGPWVKHFMFDDKLLRNFWIYPQPTTRQPRLQVACSFEPTPCDIYLPTNQVNPAAKHTTVDVPLDAALVDYILARQYQQQGEGEAQQRAANHMTVFYKLLGLNKEAETYVNPNRPTVPSVASSRGDA